MATATPPADYTVVARRYRPQQFADLIGQEHVAGALANALSSGRIAHAYLFTGARGVGKTSTARILAKAFNCARGPTATPCDECDICQGIMSGEDVDVIEIDAASNTGVENIRELRQNVGFRPQRARNKVYIIDEVHMLSNSAFNALLKTLEEPPAHVKFIFATTEAHKIPVTILSRCQRFDFAHIGPAKLFETLRHIVRKEGLEADDDALKAVVRRAGGSMRDAQTLLDQLLGGAAGGKLTAEAVHALLGTAGDDRVGELADAILNGDGAAAVRFIGEADDRGIQIGELLDQLIDFWRGLMLVRVAGPDAVDLPGSPELQQKLHAHAEKVTLDTVLAGIDILTTAKIRMRGSNHGPVLMEVAVVRLSRLDDLLSIGQLVEALTGGGTLPPRMQADISAGRGQTTHNPPANAEAALKKNEIANGKLPAANGTPAPVTPTVAPQRDDFESVWQRVLREMGPVRGESLRSANKTAIIGPNALAIRFSPRYNSAYDTCSSDASLDAIRAALKRQTGADWQVRVEQDRLAPADPGTIAGPRPGPSRSDPRTLPLFKRAKDVLDAELVKVDDDFDPTTRPSGRTDPDQDDDADDTAIPTDPDEA